MDILTALFGVKDHVSLPQECARAFLIFFYGLILLRLSGQRTFGHWSALDIVLSIVVGSALGRAVTGNAPLPGTMAAAAVMVGLHVLVAIAVARSRSLSQLVEGRPIILVERGRVNHKARKDAMISESDLSEALRQEGIDGFSGIEEVETMTLEPSGKISIVKASR
ncbi:DUF421 domain-containing protein [Mesorhizobium sp. SP-1A]|uniref:DUF421 domain-containing protein n=1 Tax=Mesorhizobium sp. SP-1A TaxID=3077840 RepID=UPI0028F6CDBA|nr:YetF domain-containing protein [Mesorhizobium sp. SP-1A]